MRSSKLSISNKQGDSFLLALAYFIAIAAIAILVWGPNIEGYRGFLYVDCNHLINSYQTNFAFSIRPYLPWVSAHRPLGRDAISLLLYLFGENHKPILSALLGVHVLNAFLCWSIIFIITDAKWWPAIVGSILFLLSANAYLPVYWPAAIFDLLSATFSLLTFLFLALAYRVGKPRRSCFLILNVLCFLLAVKAKESALMLVIPMAVMFLIFAEKHQAIIRLYKEATQNRNKNILRLFLSVFSWLEIFWGSVIVVLVIALSFNLASDFKPNASGEVATPYLRDFSFTQVFTGLGLYLANFVYIVAEKAPLSPWASFAIITGALILSFSFRNILMIVGSVWWISFLVVLAAMSNQYRSPHYPYPATVGAAFFLAGVIFQLSAIIKNKKLSNIITSIVSTAIISTVVFCCHHWLNNDAVTKWYKQHITEGMKIFEGFKKVVPAPSSNAEFVIIMKQPSMLDQGASIMLRVAYHDLSLKGKYFKSKKFAYLYFKNSSAVERYLLEWNNGQFKLIDKIAPDVQ